MNLMARIRSTYNGTLRKTHTYASTEYKTFPQSLCMNLLYAESRSDISCVRHTIELVIPEAHDVNKTDPRHPTIVVIFCVYFRVLEGQKRGLA